MLEARHINTWPMNNVPGTIVTMMNPAHVRDVLIAGRVVCGNASSSVGHRSAVPANRTGA